MAIFGNTMLNPVIEQEEYSNIIGTEECGMDIMCEAASELYKLMSGMYVSDVLIENAVDEGATNAEELMEATIKEIAIKARNKFIELKNKIVAWFKKVFDSVKNFFMDASKFATKYEKTLMEKAAVLKDYTYNGYTYTGLPTTEVAGLYDEIKGVADTARTASTVDSLPEPSDKFEELFKKLGNNASSIGATMEYLKKTWRNGAESSSEVTVNKAMVSTMIAFCKAYSANVAKIDDAKKKTENLMNGIISDLKADKDTDGALIQRKVKYYTLAANYIQTANVSVVSMYKEMYRTYGSVLKGVLTTKKVTESYDADSELFESAGFVDKALKMI